MKLTERLRVFANDFPAGSFPVTWETLTEAADSIDQLVAALVEAKREMWLAARPTWNMDDFKRWAVIEQIDAALEMADGKPRTARTLQGEPQ